MPVEAIAKEQSNHKNDRPLARKKRSDYRIVQP